MSVRNSSLVFCCVRKQPSIQDVMVADPGFCTPRIVIHRCLESDCQIFYFKRQYTGVGVCQTETVTYVASMTTATPRGLIASSTAIAICLVRRSWTCKRRLNVSAMRASLESPRTSFRGIYAIDICKQSNHRVSLLR